MGPIGVFVIILLGVFVPFVTIIILPIRGAYRMFFGSWDERLVWGCLLVPWAYFLLPILKHGYVSVQSTPTAPHFTGPTVDPRVWIVLGICWFLVEVMLKGSDKAVASGLAETRNRAPSAPDES